MSVFIAGLTFLVLLASVVYSFSPKRKYVLFGFAVLSSGIYLFLGLYNSANFLGVGKAWSLLDVILLCMVVLVWPLSKHPPVSKPIIDVPMVLLVILVVAGFVLGSMRSQAAGVLNYSRKFLYIPTYFVAARILSDPQTVKQLYKLVKISVPVVLCFHILVATRMIAPPVAEEVMEQMRGQYTEMIRVGAYIAPAIYLFAFVICLAALLYPNPRKVANIVILAAAGFGILISQTRALYLAMGMAVVGAIMMLRGKIKLALIVAVATILIVLVTEIAGISLFFRFTEIEREGNFWSRYWNGWRGAEYGILLNEFMKEPQYLLTGQGFGIIHMAPQSELGFVTFFHNQYLKFLSVFGLVGFTCFIIITVACITGGRQYARDPRIGPLVSPVRLFFFATILPNIVGGYSWAPSTGALMLCFMAISRNSDYLARQIIETEYEKYEYEYEEQIVLSPA